jgi:hypothetical protein
MIVALDPALTSRQCQTSRRQRAPEPAGTLRSLKKPVNLSDLTVVRAVKTSRRSTRCWRSRRCPTPRRRRTPEPPRSLRSVKKPVNLSNLKVALAVRMSRLPL